MWQLHEQQCSKTIHYFSLIHFCLFVWMSPLLTTLLWITRIIWRFSIGLLMTDVSFHISGNSIDLIDYTNIKFFLFFLVWCGRFVNRSKLNHPFTMHSTLWRSVYFRVVLFRPRNKFFFLFEMKNRDSICDSGEPAKWHTDRWTIALQQRLCGLYGDCIRVQVINKMNSDWFDSCTVAVDKVDRMSAGLDKIV